MSCVYTHTKTYTSECFSDPRVHLSMHVFVHLAVNVGSQEDIYTNVMVCMPSNVNICKGLKSPVRAGQGFGYRVWDGIQRGICTEPTS